MRNLLATGEASGYTFQEAGGSVRNIVASAGLPLSPTRRALDGSAAGPRSGRSMHACRFCGSSHASKTKLFNHLRESYACAAAAIAENPDAATSLCRAMSRATRRQARWSDPRSWLAEAGWSLGQPEAPGRLRAAFQMAGG